MSSGEAVACQRRRNQSLQILGKHLLLIKDLLFEHRAALVQFYLLQWEIRASTQANSDVHSRMPLTYL